MRPRIEPEALAAYKAAPNSPQTREAWLEEALPLIGDLFEEAGYALPTVKVSCSFPGGGSPSKRIGECWPKGLSSAGLNEIFISPYLDEPIQVLDVLVHECAHAVDDCQSGHGKGFKKIAEAVGLEGPMRSAHAGEDLRATLAFMSEFIGPYPHSKLQAPTKRTRKKRATLASFTCTGCSGSFYVTEGAACLVNSCPFCGEGIMEQAEGE